MLCAYPVVPIETCAIGPAVAASPKYRNRNGCRLQADGACAAAAIASRTAAIVQQVAALEGRAKAETGAGDEAAGA